MAERNLSIDLIKVVAMFSVIALHTFCGTMEWRTANIFYESAVVAVPLFFMVSGYLMIGKQNVDFLYACKKIMNIVKIVFVLSVIVLIVEFLNGAYISFMHCMKVFGGAFLQIGPLWHCWYLGAMIIIYCLLPLINKIETRKQYCTIVLLLCIIETAIFVLCFFYSESYSEMYVIQTFLLWNWLFYFMLGGLVKMLPKIRRNDLLCIFVVLILPMNIVIQEWLKPYVNSPFCELFYCSIHVTLYAVALFILLLNFQPTNRFFSHYVNFISPLFLSVYLLHPFVITLIAIWLPIPSPFDRYAYFALTSIVTVCLCNLINKVSFVNRLLKI